MITTTQEAISEKTEKEILSIMDNHNEESNDKNKDVFILILKPSEKKIDFKGLNYETKNNIEPIIVFQKRINKENGTYLEEIVFKFEKKKRNKPTKYAIKFVEGDHTYNIRFSLKDECFVYMPELKTGNKYLDNILEEPIKQNIVPLSEKLNIFIEALQYNKEIEKKEKKLYEDSIDLYEKKKQFSFLISLFLKIYDKNKELCKKLIEIFYEINEKENDDKENDLKKEVKFFEDIYSNSLNILEENNYNKIHFYGLLFCYLHYYNKDNFPKMIEEFSEGNSDILYEILIHYYLHFIYPLKQSQKFYNGFVKYALNKKKGFKRIKTNFKLC